MRERALYMCIELYEARGEFVFTTQGAIDGTIAGKMFALFFMFVSSSKTLTWHKEKLVDHP